MAPISQDKTSLLLLPALSLPLKRSSLKTAYQSTFSQLLPNLVAGPHEVPRLDIAILLSDSYPVVPPASRSSVFEAIQSLLEETYTLICAVAAQVKVELDFPGGIDPRVFVLESRTDQLSQDVIGKQPFSGPVVDIQTFVQSRTKYQTIYSVEGERGEQYWNLFLQAWQARHRNTPSLRRLPCGPAVTLSKATRIPAAEQRSTRHKAVAVGGTFDHLHVGHKLLLTATVFLPEPGTSDHATTPRQITIGITGDELLVNKKHADLVESWDERQRRTEEFVESVLVFHPDASSVTKVERIDKPGPNGKVVRVIYGDELIINYTQISDPFGPTITEENITAIIISKETRAGGKAVNDKREEKGWEGLEVFEVDILDANALLDDERVEKQTFESKISSTEIRKRLQQKQNL